MGYTGWFKPSHAQTGFMRNKWGDCRHAVRQWHTAVAPAFSNSYKVSFKSITIIPGTKNTERNNKLALVFNVWRPCELLCLPDQITEPFWNAHCSKHLPDKKPKKEMNHFSSFNEHWIANLPTAINSPIPILRKFKQCPLPFTPFPPIPPLPHSPPLLF